MSTLLKERSTYWLIGGGSSAATDGDFRPYWKIYYDQEPANNRTLITVQYYLQVYCSGSDAVSVGITSTCKINGSSIGTITKGQTTYSTSGLKSLGSKTTYIYHNADGTASFTFQGNGGYGDWSKSTAVSTYTLPTLPRYATCSQSFVSKSETQITMNWSSDSTIDYLWYSINNGSSWVGIGNPNSTNGSYTITGLSPNTTYNIKTRVRRADSQLTTDSSSNSIATYAIPTQSISDITETSMKVTWYASANANYVWYSIDNGSSWVEVGAVSGTSGYFTISNLSPGTTYKIRTRVRLSATNTYYNNGTNASEKTTYNYPYVDGYSNFVIGDKNGGPQIKVVNPLNREYSCTIYGKDGSAIGSYSGTYNGTLNAEFITDEAILQQYKSLPDDPSATYKIQIIYGSHKPLINGGTYSVDEATNRPTFDGADFTYEDVNSKTTNLTGDSSKIINKYSTVKVSVKNDAQAKNEAKMEYYIINGIQYGYESGFTTEKEGNILNFDDSIIRIFAKDTRGFSSSPAAEKNVTLVTNDNKKTYFNITKNDNQPYSRSNQGVGKEVTFNFSGTWWNGNFGNVQNSLKANYTIYNNKTKEEKEGTTTINITTNGDEYSFSGVLYGDTDNGFDIESSYNVAITISDELSSATFNYVVIEGSPAIALYGNCVALGSPYDTAKGGRVQINGEPYSKVSVNDIYPIGSIYMSINSTNPSTLFGGTWEQIKGRFLLGQGGNLANTSDYWGSASANSVNMPNGEMGGTYQPNVSFNHTHPMPHTHPIPHAHSMSHTHSIGSHVHYLGDAGYAKIQHNNGKFWFKEIATATWVDSGSATASGTNNETNNSAGIPLGGTTNGSDAFTSGASSISKTGGTDTANSGGVNTANTGGASTSSTTLTYLPPYLVVYIWKRTA